MKPWFSLLACPTCGAPVTDTDLRCDGCNFTYERRGEVPVLVRGQSRDRDALDGVDGQAMVSGYRRPSRLLKFLRAVISSEYFPGEAWRRARAQTVNHGGQCLVLGSGVSRYPNSIHMDLDDFPGVDVIGDAHHLPFRGGVMDGVVCEVVLEHVFNPRQVIAETFRVLKPGGRFFFIVPFLFPFHGHPSDYRRWSSEGLRADFDQFEELEVGVHGGPCSAMVNLLSEWAYVFMGFRYPRFYVPVKGGVTALLFPLKFFDWWVNRLPEAHRMAGTLYIAGRKPNQ